MKARETTDRRRATLAALLAVLALSAPTARAQVFATGTGTAEFTSSVPLHSFTGTSDRLVGRIDMATDSVDFYLDLETLDTGIGKRDKDMRKTLDTARFPFAEFLGRLETPVNPAAAGAQRVRVRGTFTIHGVSRALTVEGALTREGTGLRLEAAWELRLDEYDIEPPSLLIVKVDPVQKIAISALLNPSPR